MILYGSDKLDDNDLPHRTKVTQLIKELYNEAMRRLRAELQVSSRIDHTVAYF